MIDLNRLMPSADESISELKRDKKEAWDAPVLSVVGISTHTNAGGDNADDFADPGYS